MFIIYLLYIYISRTVTAIDLLLDSGEVIFDCNSPDEPPDFIFGPDDEDFLPPMEEMEVGSYTYIYTCIHIYII